jgi:hypothetical protein
MQAVAVVAAETRLAADQVGLVVVVMVVVVVDLWEQ